MSRFCAKSKIMPHVGFCVPKDAPQLGLVVLTNQKVFFSKVKDANDVVYMLSWSKYAFFNGVVLFDVQTVS